MHVYKLYCFIAVTSFSLYGMDAPQLSPVSYGQKLLQRLCAYMAKKGSTKIATMLLNSSFMKINQRGLSHKNTLLMYAITHFLPLLKKILEKPELNPNIHHLSSGASPLVLVLSQPIQPTSSLSHALSARLSVFKKLLQLGANPNFAKKNGDTPLHIACFLGLTKEVDLLLDYGADPDIQNEQGLTPLIIACISNNESLVDLLLKSNAQPTIKDLNKVTPLHIAAKKGILSLVKKLVEANALINEQDKRGNTPILEASNSGHFPVVTYLLEKRADPNISNNDNLTPLSLAAFHGHVEICRVLLVNFANPNKFPQIEKNSLYLTIARFQQLSRTNVTPTSSEQELLNSLVRIIRLLIRFGASIEFAQKKEIIIALFPHPVIRSTILGDHLELTKHLYQPSENIRIITRKTWQRDDTLEPTMRPPEDDIHLDPLDSLVINRALLYATGQQHLNIIPVLLHEGANPFKKHTHGENAMLLLNVCLMRSNLSDEMRQNYIMINDLLKKVVKSGSAEVSLLPTRNPSFGNQLDLLEWDKTAFHVPFSLHLNTNTRPNSPHSYSQSPK